MKRGPARGITEAMRPMDAVAHPVRLRMVRHLADSGPASLTELADAAGVHENTARNHVLALEEGGLVTSERRPLDRPGRPGINYRLVDTAAMAPSQLAQLLGAALDRAGPSREELRETGRDWGRYLVGRPESHDITSKLPEVLEQIGFRGRVRDNAVELTGCPCAGILSSHPGLVCCLAEGVIDGALAASGSPQRVGAADHHPEKRECRIELVVVDGDGPTSDRAPRTRGR
jgi:predicted ArsR family transcriptional regulator